MAVVVDFAAHNKEKQNARNDESIDVLLRRNKAHEGVDDLWAGV
jgi:hypothetical protein